MKDFELAISGQRLVVSPDLFTPRNIIKFKKDLEDCDKTNSARIADVLKHISELALEIQEQSKKGEDESEEDHEKRTETLREEYNKKVAELLPEEGLDSLFPLAFGIVEIVGRMAKQEQKVSSEGLQDVPWVKTREFIYNILKFCGFTNFAEIFNPEVK